MQNFPFQDPALKNLLDRELKAGETLRWTGQPNPARFARRVLPVSLFAIPWTAFAVFWIGSAARWKMPDFSHPGVPELFPLFGLPFLVVGFFMMSAPFRERMKARKTIYAVSNQRAIILQDLRTKRVQSFTAEKLRAVERNELPGGSGDLVFDRQYERSANCVPYSNKIGFFGVADVKAIEKLLLEAAEYGK